jgi:hypothetical protein
MKPCDKCGASPDKQLAHEGFGGKKIVLCKSCGNERSAE